MSGWSIENLAAAAGLSTRWHDFRGREHQVSEQSLRRILAALELPADSPAQIADSAARLAAESNGAQAGCLTIADAGAAIPLPGANRGSVAARLIAEDGETMQVSVQADGHGRLWLPPAARTGYYELHYGDERVKLALCPRRCYGVADAAAGERIWGLSAQLYPLRREGDGGIGDFSALATLAREAASRGADALAISPVHALFNADLSRFSPYAPSSRLFLNPLHADPATMFGPDAVQRVVEQLGLGQKLAGLEQEHLIDWPAAAAARFSILRQFHADWHVHLHESQDRVALDYRSFVRAGGSALREHACFEALHAARFSGDPGQWHWRNWPAALRNPGSTAVADFAAAHLPELDFHLFLQWLADRGLGVAQAQARAAGMRIGLIADMAIGIDSGGSQVWSRQHEVLAGLSVGAPPDPLNGQGQDWGLTAFSPRALRQHDYQPFIEILRAGLRHAGGLRIDHVLGLGRLWLIPEGSPSSEGAYLAFPMQELMRLVALESWRYRAIVVGEDLGTVPDGFRARLADGGILGLQVLWFEREHEYFIEPARWSAQALATTTTHDLPTVAGWWRGRDIDWRARLGQFAEGSGESGERGQRARDRRALWGAFEHAGATVHAMPALDQPEPALDAAMAFIGKTPSPLAIVPVDDLLGLVEQPNVPGTIDEHPNWRRRLPVSSEELLRTGDAQRRTAILHAARKE